MSTPKAPRMRRVFESGDADAPKLWPRFPLKVTKALPNPICDVRPELRVDPDRVSKKHSQPHTQLEETMNTNGVHTIGNTVQRLARAPLAVTGEFHRRQICVEKHGGTGDPDPRLNGLSRLDRCRHSPGHDRPGRTQVQTPRRNDSGRATRSSGHLSQAHIARRRVHRARPMGFGIPGFTVRASSFRRLLPHPALPHIFAAPTVCVAG